MEAISVFDMFKIGVGPSSSHTLGPWRAVQRFLAEVPASMPLEDLDGLRVDLYGSLALTGRGHATDKAICLALLGEDPETVDTTRLDALLAGLERDGRIRLAGGREIPFDPARDIVYHEDERLPAHANGLRLVALAGDREFPTTWYSIGGGFVLREGEAAGGDHSVDLPHPFDHASELLDACRALGGSISDVVEANETAWRPGPKTRAGVLRIWSVMRDCVFRGCHAGGELPGGLGVTRRAARTNRALLADVDYDGIDGWMAAIRASRKEFPDVLRWVSTFALAVNEENAALGRVVTAPTNGAAGVIPAVLTYHACFGSPRPDDERIVDFLLTASAIGALFKKNATISAAMGGCQAEIGVSSSMAAAGLTELLGGTVEQCLMAAEIAMEHHLGMTCDPVGGLVQVPCIERNAMGAIKAITAARLALDGDPHLARVSLDDVIRTMWQTAQDMQERYKETSRGGLAVNVSVRVAEC